MDKRCAPPTRLARLASRVQGLFHRSDRTRVPQPTVTMVIVGTPPDKPPLDFHTWERDARFELDATF